MNTMKEIHKIRDGITLALEVIFGAVFLGGLFSLVYFLIELAGPLS